MRIATITCHDVYNYGASLQAYALQAYCQSLGHDYRIINYKPPYLSNHHQLSLVANPRFDKPFVKQLYLLAKLPGRLRNLKRKRLFDNFTRQFLNLTPDRYASSQEIADKCPQADLFVAGSDQIWNTLFQNGRDAAFYLDFVKRNGRKISYAASFATEKIHNGADDFVRNALSNFDAISVRESSALTLLETLGHNDGHLVCDPVFLLNKDEWNKLLQKTAPTSGKYILVYDCEKSRTVKEIAQELQRQTNLPIYSISPTFGHYSKRNMELSGPIEFLASVAGASYVVANSFHALAFSLIYHKDFFIVNRSEGINTRMRDFLDYLGLSNRLVTSVNQVTLDGVNYENTKTLLDSLIASSKAFLESQFEQS